MEAGQASCSHAIVLVMKITAVPVIYEQVG